MEFFFGRTRGRHMAMGQPPQLVPHEHPRQLARVALPSRKAYLRFWPALSPPELCFWCGWGLEVRGGWPWTWQVHPVSPPEVGEGILGRGSEKRLSFFDYERRLKLKSEQVDSVVLVVERGSMLEPGFGRFNQCLKACHQRTLESCVSRQPNGNRLGRRLKPPPQAVYIYIYTHAHIFFQNPRKTDHFKQIRVERSSSCDTSECGPGEALYQAAAGSFFFFFKSF